ncbi:hypothetical protein HPB47_025423 [Ixodes persulcatus]|uniref:Uncharacterized protein n=1 Tax=Ixodes persulcatus TaxID=34615 RepID=A0AC60Q3W9_IXOPE|nr:hypothetical protein HPB47_025423 [Ixodes persulcatus]
MPAAPPSLPELPTMMLLLAGRRRRSAPLRRRGAPTSPPSAARRLKYGRARSSDVSVGTGRRRCRRSAGDAGSVTTTALTPRQKKQDEKLAAVRPAEQPSRGPEKRARSFVYFWEESVWRRDEISRFLGAGSLR